MRKINIKDIFIDVDLLALSELIKTNNELLIDIDGNVFTNSQDTKDKAVIFHEKDLSTFLNIADLKELANKLFEKYKPELIGSNCKIKPLNNWQNIIDLNKENMLYFDHQSDGVEIFEDETLEDYGWNATVLEINYRTISGFIEDNCEGTLLFYDNEIQFSGFAIIDNIEEVRVQVKEFIKKQALVNKDENLFELDDDEVIEALEYFGLEG